MDDRARSAEPPLSEASSSEVPEAKLRSDAEPADEIRLDTVVGAGVRSQVTGGPARELALAVAVPGLTTMRRREALGAALLTAGIGLPVGLVLWVLLRRDGTLSTALDGRFQVAVMTVAVLFVLARVGAVVEVGVSRSREPSGPRTAIALTIVAALAIPVGVVVARVVDARSSIDEIFATSNDGPVFDIADFTPESGDPVPTPVPTSVPASSTIAVEAPGGVAGGVPAAPTSISTTTTTTTTLPPVDKSLLTGVRTVLLLGGDAGPGRFGLRTDTMILVSIDEESGRTGLVSIPRDLRQLRFPPGTPLADLYPDGFDGLANAIYPTVSVRPDLREFYGQTGLRPQIVAVAQALGYSLGVSIHDVVLINMQGFLSVIDALGGVTVDVTKQLPMPGNVPGAKHELPPTLGPGVLTLDGTLALGYVRSRKGDSDYQRMGRQRTLLAALGSQISTADVVLRFHEITNALGSSMRTTLSAEEFVELLALLGDTTLIVESVGLTPPLVRLTDPNFAWLDQIVAEVQLALVTGEPSGY
jgi:LCP family protein required for cell wall assembly